jgi:hypothetical protein
MLHRNNASAAEEFHRVASFLKKFLLPPRNALLAYLIERFVEALCAPGGPFRSINKRSI